MKLAKRFIALAMVALMLVSSCIVVSASATVSMSVSTNHVVVSGVDYAKYSVYGSQSRHTETATVLEFNPANGYIPMAFASNAGSCNVLSTQYSTAVNKYGYEVAGVINGSYFDMASGTLSGILISGGKVSCADIGYSYGNKLSVVAFGTDGSMNVVDSQLSYRLYINGTEVPDALRFINKVQSSDSWKPDSIFYYDTSCGTTADTSGTGYEVICQKIDGSDLTVGGTMQAKVVEVRSNTSGTKFESDSNTVSDKFVLFAPKNGSYASYLSGLSAGDTVEIAIEETIAASKEIMENASSVITNVGWLVKNGVDQTDSNSVIGDHSVTGTYARWTAFGQKADGTYVFFTSEGGDTGDSSRSLTLKDVAAAMIQLGCVNVIRMDGGGSSAMYVSNTGSGSAGYVQSHTRAVADCILIIKNPDKTSALKAELKAAIEKAEAVSHTNYTEATLQQLRAAYESAKVVYNNANATETQITAATNNLNTLIAQTGSSSSSGAQGSTGTSDSLWVTHYNDGQEGAGVIFTQAYTNGEWNLHFAFTPVSGTNAFKITAIQNGLADGGASPLAIPAGGFVYTLNSGNDWSQIGDSSDGDINYKSDAVQAMIAKASEWKVGDMFVFSGIDTAGLTVPTTTSGTNWYDPSYVCTATYAPYTITSSGTSDTVSDGVYITGFNTSVTAGSSVIFTSAFNNGRITVDSANHRWTTNVICTWDSSKNGYVITSVDADKGEDGNTEDIVLSSNQILIAAHNWESEVPGSELNEQTLATAEVGQVLRTYGVDISNCYLSAAPYVRFLGAGESDSNDSSGGTVLNGKMFWLTHYNDLTAEGAGVIVTTSDLAGGTWNNYYAFAPVAGTDAYEIIDISIGIGTGTSSLPAIPAGGFVYSINEGNNYPANGDNTQPDYTSDNCYGMISEVANWQKGDQFVFSGIDFVGNTVPTSTSATNWYDDAYVCTAVFAPYGVTDDNDTSEDVSNDSSVDDSSDSSKDDTSKDESDNDSSKDESKDDEIDENLGDVNLDGRVDQFDYVLVKRHYFNTYVLSDEEAERADVNLDNVVDQFDYVLLKRIYFNTYTLPNKNT